MVGHLSSLRRWRMENGITLQEAADLCDLSEAMLSLVERGKRNLAPLTKVRVARCLGARVSELFDVEVADEERQGVGA